MESTFKVKTKKVLNQNRLKLRNKYAKQMLVGFVSVLLHQSISLIAREKKKEIFPLYMLS